MDLSRIHQIVLESMREAVYVRDLDMNILYINPASEQLTGWSLEGAKRKKCYEVFGDEQARCRDICLAEKAIAGGVHILHREGSLKSKSGEIHEMQVSISPIHETGEVAGAVVVMEDITRLEVVEKTTAKALATLEKEIEARKRAEEKLKESDSQKQAILDGITTNLAFVNEHLEILWANKAAADSVEKSPFQMIGHKCHELWADPAKPCDGCPTVKAFKTKRSERTTIVTPDGRVWDEKGEPVFDSQGRLVGVVEIGHDITEHKRAEEDLAKSEALLKAVLDASPVGIALVKNRNLEWANKTLYDLFGYKPDDIQEADVRQFYMSDDDYQRTGDTLYAGLTKGEVRETEVFYKRRNGITFPCLIRVTMIEDDPDNLTVVAVFMDITERKMSEESIRIRLNLLEFAASHSLDELLQKTLDEITALTKSSIGFYHFVESDQKTLSLQAWSTQTVREFCRAEGKGLHYPINQAGVWVDCIHERKPVIHNDYSSLPHRKGMPEGHASVTRELVVPIIKSDRIVAVLGIGNKPTDYTEKDVEICSYLADVAWEIAERKRAEEALKESEQRYRALFEESRDGVYSVLSDGEITDANRSFCELFGYTKEEMIGKDIRELYFDPADRPKFQKEIQTKGFVQDYEVKWRKTDGSSMDCLLTSSIIFGTNGNILGYRGIIRDVTDRKRLQHQLLQAQKMEAIGTLAGGIAHDFNNLLQVTMGFSELLLAEKDLKHPDYADLRKIFHAARNGADLVQRLLMFSRKSEPKPVPMHLNKQIVQVEKLLRRTIPRMIAIDMNLSPDLPAIKADPSQMEQVLMNLAVNARDAMGDVGKLTVKTDIVTLDDDYCRLHLEATPGEYVLLEVSDTGSGMDKETVEHIYEPFFTTKALGRGTGLGLAMVYGIVKQHNGHITVSSEVGKGTTFKVYLPAMPADAEPELQETSIMPAFGTETVLLVDDEEFVRELGARILTKHGYTVLQAENGRDALDLFKEEHSKISLVILDLIMPKMGGKACLKELLKIDPQVSVLVASGYPADASVKETIQMGAKGFVSKPFRVKELLRDVRKALDKDD